MIWSASEAEELLRTLTEGTEDIGGFCSLVDRQETLKFLEGLWGAGMLDGWTLIGESAWNDYEEGCTTYLLLEQEYETLWSIQVGHSVMVGDYGNDFRKEIAATTIEEWLETVVNNEEAMKDFQGC